MTETISRNYNCLKTFFKKAIFANYLFQSHDQSSCPFCPIDGPLFLKNNLFCLFIFLWFFNIFYYRLLLYRGLVHHHRRILNLSVIDNNIVLCNSPSFCSSVISSSTDEKVKIDSSLSCISENVKYLITCSKQDKTCKENPTLYWWNRKKILWKVFGTYWYSFKHISTSNYQTRRSSFSFQRS